MLRITRLTDYGIAILAHFALSPLAARFNTRELGEAVNVPACTVGKIVKGLTRAGILVSTRGASGGYQLARPPAAISLRDIVRALEGPISVAPGPCDDEGAPVAASVAGDAATTAEVWLGANWQLVNDVVRQALEGIALPALMRERGWSGEPGMHKPR